MKDSKFNRPARLFAVLLTLVTPALTFADSGADGDAGHHHEAGNASGEQGQGIPAKEAAALYRANCAQCHGGKGDGASSLSEQMNPPPTNFTRFDVAAELTRERMIRTITRGKPGTAMEGFSDRLSAEQIEAIADYVRDEFMPAVTTDLSDRGRAIYAKNCSVCHGDRGQGAVWARSGLSPAPANFADPMRVKDLTRERMIFSVTYGRPQTAMAAWGKRFSPQEIEAVVDYIRESFFPEAVLQGQVLAAANREHDDGGGQEGGHDHNAHGADGLMAPLPKGLKGNPVAGGELYQQNCADCHGRSGDGQGPRAFFIFPKPRDFRHPAARAKYSREHLFYVIADGVVGSEMPAWKHALSEQQIADISEYVFETFIHPENTRN